MDKHIEMSDLEEKLNILKEKIDNFDLGLLNEEELNSIRKELDKHELAILCAEKVVPTFKRLTVNKYLPENNNETVNEISLLKNPPAESVKKYGRANLINQSILYGTFILPTALLELNPEVGDIVTVSEWELKNENDALVEKTVKQNFLFLTSKG